MGAVPGRDAVLTHYINVINKSGKIFVFRFENNDEGRARTHRAVCEYAMDPLVEFSNAEAIYVIHCLMALASQELEYELAAVKNRKPKVTDFAYWFAAGVLAGHGVTRFLEGMLF